MLVDVLLVLDQFVAQELFEMAAHSLQLGNTIDDVPSEVETVEVIQYGHIKRSSRSAFFFVAADVQVFVIMSTVRQSVNQLGIAVVGEDDWLIHGK